MRGVEFCDRVDGMGSRLNLYVTPAFDTTGTQLRAHFHHCTLPSRPSHPLLPDSCRKLCAANRYTCWMGGDAPEGLCNLMTQEGYGVQQACKQPVRFVCRTKGV